MAGDNGYITLMGAEQVQSAANTMRSAADSMIHAADNMRYSLEMHERFMNEWLAQLEQILEAHNASRTKE